MKTFKTYLIENLSLIYEDFEKNRKLVQSRNHLIRFLTLNFGDRYARKIGRKIYGPLLKMAGPTVITKYTDLLHKTEEIAEVWATKLIGYISEREKKVAVRSLKREAELQDAFRDIYYKPMVFLMGAKTVVEEMKAAKKKGDSKAYVFAKIKLMKYIYNHSDGAIKNRAKQQIIKLKRLYKSLKHADSL